MHLQDIIIILSRPQEDGNIGAVCRAMKNMGLTHLRIVSPSPEIDEKVIRARAVHAEDIWENTKCFDNFSSAIVDCSFVVGTTRRRGRYRKSVTLNPEELSLYLKEKEGQTAIVFGNERTGLEAEELSLCNIASHIPSNPDFPSLNLSHSVQIYTYQLFRSLNSQEDVKGTWISMNRNEIDLLVKDITHSLETLGFYKQPGRIEQEEFLRDIFSRAGLSVYEGAYMKNLFEKTMRLGSR